MSVRTCFSGIKVDFYCSQCLVYFLYDAGRNYFLSLNSYDTCFQDLTETFNTRVPITGCKQLFWLPFKSNEQVLYIVVKKRLSESLASRNVNLWEPSNTFRLSFDYSDFFSIIYALNTAWIKFGLPVYIFFIFAEKDFYIYERVLVSSTDRLEAFRAQVSLKRWCNVYNL